MAMKKLTIISALVLTGGILFAQEQVQRKKATTREQRETVEVKAQKTVSNLDNTVDLTPAQNQALLEKLKTQDVKTTEDLKATHILNDVQIQKIEAKDEAHLNEMKNRPSRANQKSAPANR